MTMNFALSEEQNLYREQMRRFGREVIAPRREAIMAMPSSCCSTTPRYSRNSEWVGRLWMRMA